MAKIVAPGAGEIPVEPKCVVCYVADTKVWSKEVSKRDRLDWLLESHTAVTKVCKEHEPELAAALLRVGDGR